MISRRTLRAAAVGLLLIAMTVVGGATPASAHTPTVTLFCQYRVTTDSGSLNVRSHHFTTSSIVGSLARGSTVIAGANGTATGSGMTWRQISGSPRGWSAAQFLTRTSAPCFS